MKTLWPILQDIQSQKDIESLIRAFYARVREHPEIGHYFNETTKDWDEHLEKLTKFWLANLFQTAGFQGNPMKGHS
jgi:hemoglobin